MSVEDSDLDLRVQAYFRVSDTISGLTYYGHGGILFRPVLRKQVIVFYPRLISPGLTQPPLARAHTIVIVPFPLAHYTIYLKGHYHSVLPARHCNLGISSEHHF